MRFFAGFRNKIHYSLEVEQQTPLKIDLNCLKRKTSSYSDHPFLGALFVSFGVRVGLGFFGSRNGVFPSQQSFFPGFGFSVPA